MGIDVTGQVLSVDALDILSGPQDGHAQGRALIRHCVEVVEDDLLNLLVHLLHLTQDHTAFTLNLRTP